MPRTDWTREQLVPTLRLYLTLPFGKLHLRNPEIIALAKAIGRTPSAVAMKACNFASLDPQHLARGRKGLSAASRADRALWDAFSADSEGFANEAEAEQERLELPRAAGDESTLVIPDGPTESQRLVRARRVQSFFRRAVLTSYESRCAISGIAEPGLLVASHIIPWTESVERRADPTNGLCLNALFDRAFDRGLLTVDEKLRVRASKRLRDAVKSAALACSLLDADGRELALPYRFQPDPTALEWHRREVFQ
ncbi:MAG: HNH endonuclease [Planctomyces sp.]|nr:HNH endonuclease [Planctomyces sp.]